MSSEAKNICTEFNQDLWLFLSQELPANRCIFWEKHLRSCESCKISLQEMKETLDVYDALPFAELNENWFNRAIQKVIQPTIHKTQPLYMPKNRNVIVTALAIAAAILLFFFIPRQQDVPNALVWEDFSVDSFIAELDSTLTYLTSDEDANVGSLLSFENAIDDLDSQIDELQNSLQLLAEDLQNPL